MARFDGEPTDDHHLIHADWHASIRRQGQALDAPIGQEHAAVPGCSCGIGTQAIGVALRGVDPRTAAGGMRRLLTSARPYDDLLRDRPTSTPPQVHVTADRAGTPEDGEFRVRARRTTSWVLGHDRLSGLATEAGLADIRSRAGE